MAGSGISRSLSFFLAQLRLSAPSLPFCPLCLGSAAFPLRQRVLLSPSSLSANVQTSWILIGTETGDGPIPSLISPKIDSPRRKTFDVSKETFHFANNYSRDLRTTSLPMNRFLLFRTMLKRWMIMRKVRRGKISSERCL